MEKYARLPSSDTSVSSEDKAFISHASLRAVTTSKQIYPPDILYLTEVYTGRRWSCSLCYLSLEIVTGFYVISSPFRQILGKIRNNTARNMPITYQFNFNHRIHSLSYNNMIKNVHFSHSLEARDLKIKLLELTFEITLYEN